MKEGEWFDDLGPHYQTVAGYYFLAARTHKIPFPSPMDGFTVSDFPFSPRPPPPPCCGSPTKEDDEPVEQEEAEIRDECYRGRRRRSSPGCSCGSRGHGRVCARGGVGIGAGSSKRFRRTRCNTWFCVGFVGGLGERRRRRRRRKRVVVVVVVKEGKICVKWIDDSAKR